jgi:hypothetical protein
MFPLDSIWNGHRERGPPLPRGHGPMRAMFLFIPRDERLGRLELRQSGGADIGDEAIDVGAQCCGLTAQLLRRGQYLVGRGAGLVG